MVWISAASWAAALKGTTNQTARTYDLQSFFDSNQISKTYNFRVNIHGQVKAQDIVNIRSALAALTERVETTEERLSAV